MRTCCTQCYRRNAQCPTGMRKGRSRFNKVFRRAVFTAHVANHQRTPLGFASPESVPAEVPYFRSQGMIHRRRCSLKIVLSMDAVSVVAPDLFQIPRRRSAAEISCLQAASARCSRIASVIVQSAVSMSFAVDRRGLKIAWKPQQTDSTSQSVATTMP